MGLLPNTFLSKATTGLLLIDFQESLFAKIEYGCNVLHSAKKVVKGFQLLQLPILATEQNPEKLGGTVAPLRELLEGACLAKMSFSCLREPAIKEKICALPVKSWVLIGLEAHICVLQTAKELLQQQHEVLVINSAVGSQSIFDYSTAIAEMRDLGVRITSHETVFFELLGSAAAQEFRQLLSIL